MAEATPFFDAYDAVRRCGRKAWAVADAIRQDGDDRRADEVEAVAHDLARLALNLRPRMLVEAGQQEIPF